MRKLTTHRWRKRTNQGPTRTGADETEHNCDNMVYDAEHTTSFIYTVFMLLASNYQANIISKLKGGGS